MSGRRASARYQFTSHFFLRTIAQFDSSRSQVLTDFLSSYEFRPGTVFYAGYGSLIEQRGVLVKASYLYRF